jgi:hypothetical protein
VFLQFTNTPTELLRHTFLLALASTIILGSECHEAHDHVLFSNGYRSLLDVESTSRTGLQHHCQTSPPNTWHSIKKNLNT